MKILRMKVLCAVTGPSQFLGPSQSRRHVPETDAPETDTPETDGTETDPPETDAP